MLHRAIHRSLVAVLLAAVIAAGCAPDTSIPAVPAAPETAATEAVAVAVPEGIVGEATTATPAAETAGPVAATFPEPPTLVPLLDNVAMLDPKPDGDRGPVLVPAGAWVTLDPFELYEFEGRDPPDPQGLIWTLPAPPLPESEQEAYKALFQQEEVGGGQVEQRGLVAVAQLPPGDHTVRLVHGPTGRAWENQVWALAPAEATRLVYDNAYTLLESDFMAAVEQAVDQSGAVADLQSKAEELGEPLDPAQWQFAALKADLLTVLEQAAKTAQSAPGSPSAGGVKGLAKGLRTPRRSLVQELDRSIGVLGKLITLVKRAGEAVELPKQTVELLGTLIDQATKLLSQSKGLPDLPDIRNPTKLTAADLLLQQYLNVNESTLVERIQAPLSIVVQTVKEGKVLIVGEVAEKASLTIEGLPKGAAVVVLRNRGEVRLGVKSTSDEGLLIVACNKGRLKLSRNEGNVSVSHNAGQIEVDWNDGEHILVGRNHRGATIKVTETGSNDLNTETLKVLDNLGTIEIGAETANGTSEGNRDVVLIGKNWAGARLTIYRNEDEISIRDNGGTIQVGAAFPSGRAGCNDGKVTVESNRAGARVNVGHSDKEVSCPPGPGKLEGKPAPCP